MRTPRRSGLVAAGLAGAVAATLVVVPPLVDDGPTDPGDDLRSRATGEVLTRPSGATRFVGTEPGRPIVLSTDEPAAAADEFTDRYGPALGAGATDLVPLSTTPSLGGGTAVRYQQELGGVPVFGAQTSVQVDADGGILSSFADLSSRAAEAPSEATVDAAEARTAALALTARETGAPRSALTASTPAPRIYDPLVLGGDPSFGVRRTWLVEVTAATPPVRHVVLVDATTGGIALAFSQIAHGLERGVCDGANDPAIPLACNPPYSRAEGAPPHPQVEVNRAYTFLGQSYQYFFSQFGRDSIDGAGMVLEAKVRHCQPGAACPYPNAFWSGAQDQVTFGTGYAVDDVVAHELTHGLTEFTANLFYWYQSGAINESMSDVFGELIDLANGVDDTVANRWLVGENLPGGPLRDMEDPPAFGHPDATTHAAYAPGPGDEGGVHSNSGVSNKAAVLMADGGTFGGQTVTALGTTKVAAVYYEALTTMLTSAGDFQDLHAALPQACLNLVTAGAAGLTGADCLEVRDAVDAVGMNTVPPAAPATDVPVCAEGDPLGDLFLDDLEATNDGTWTYQNPIGPRWAYGSEVGLEYATSGTQGLWGANLGSTADRSVALTAAVDLPAGSHPVLHFRHAYGFDTSGANNWDGGVVEYSTDGLGGPWTDLGPRFEENGYTGTLVATGTNPIRGRPAFVNESRGYLSSRADLAPLAGQSVRLRFRIGEDQIVGDRGWFIDDIRIADCENLAVEVTQVAGDDTVVAGEDIDVEVTVRNTGNLALTGVTLDNSTATACDQALADLVPGASVVINCSYPTVDPDDVGPWTNVATVTADQLLPPGVSSDPLVVEVAAPNPSVALALAAHPSTVTAGDDISVDVTVTNDGNVALTGIALVVAAAPACSGPIADLAPAAEVVVECAYTTVDPDDVGTWSGTAEVTADQVVGTVTSAPAAVTVLAPGTALVTVGHRAVEATVLLGDPVTLDVSITNAGNVPLTGVTITAPGAPECGGPITDPIPVGGEHVVECSHTPTEVGTWSSTVSVTSVELPDPTTSPTITVDVLAVTVRRPDGWIRKGISGPIAGDDLYNTTGAQQNRVVKLTRAQRQVTFFVTAQNDGTHPERLRVRGQPSTTHYTVRYFSAGQDVTTRVNNGTFRTPVLAPGLTRTVKVVVTARPTAPLGGQVDRRVTLSSVNDPTKVDVVRFIVKRR